MVRRVRARGRRWAAPISPIGAAALAALLLAAILPAAAAGTTTKAPRPGAPCTSPGHVAKAANGQRLRCTRRGGRLGWTPVRGKSGVQIRLGGKRLTPAQGACLEKALGASTFAKLIARGNRTSLTAAQLAKLKKCGASVAGDSNTSSGGQGGQGGSQLGYARAGNGGDSSAKDLPACSGTALLNHLPTSDVGSIEPLGHTLGEHIIPIQADHIYLYPSSGGPAPTVYAPGRVTLLQVVAQTHKGADASLGTDYTVAFSSCKSVMFAFLHMRTLSDRIHAAMNAAKSTCDTGTLSDNCTYPDLSLQLASGEAMGTALPAGFALDFTATDVRTPTLAFIRQTNLIGGSLGDSYAHAVCALDYFVAPLKSELYAKLQTKNGGANGVPACGAVMQDKSGTSQGNWYRPGTGQIAQGNSLTGLLALVHLDVDPTQAVLSAGTALLPSNDFGAQIIYQPQAAGFVDPDPSRITPDGHVYCIEGVLQPDHQNGHVDVSMTDATTLKADYASGGCAATPALGANAVTYNR